MLTYIAATIYAMVFVCVTLSAVGLLIAVALGAYIDKCTQTDE